MEVAAREYAPCTRDSWGVYSDGSVPLLFQIVTTFYATYIYAHALNN